MSTTTSNFNLVLPEGTDTFNPLTFNNDAFTAIDTQMKKNQDAAVTTATHTYIDGINTILRAIGSCNLIVFSASNDYVKGSQVAVDGVSCTFRLANGQEPSNGAFVTNQTVLCYLNGTILNMISAGSKQNVIGTDVSFESTTGLEETNVSAAIDAVNNSLTKLITIGNGTTNATVNTTSSYPYPSGVSKTTHALVCAEVLCSGNWRSDQLANVYMGDNGLACAPISSVATSQPLRIVYVKIS